MLLDGENIATLPIYQRALKGLGFVPQEREIFPVAVGAGKSRNRRAGRLLDIETAFSTLFPRLARAPRQYGQPIVRRRAADAVDRARADDQPVGSADGRADRRPRARFWSKRLAEVLGKLRDEGALTIVLVEQNSRVALAFSPRTVVMDKGRVVYDGPLAVACATTRSG